MVESGMAVLSGVEQQAHSVTRKAIVAALGAFSLLAAACGGSSVSSIETLPPATTQTDASEVQTTTTLDLPPPDPFHVVGTQILDPNGDVFYPVGANVAISTTDYFYVFEGGNGGVNDHVADVQAWNWNVVRANLKCFTDDTGPTTEQVVSGIDRTVKELTAARIVVILECHDGTGSDVLLGSEIEKRVGAFWDQVVERYKDNPYVWFNFFNEPFESDDFTNWKSLNDFYISRYREKSDNIIIVDLPFYGQGLNLFEKDLFPESFTDACNVVYGWHAYGALGEEDLTVDDYRDLIETVQKQEVAIIASEVGYVDASVEGSEPTIDNADGLIDEASDAEAAPGGLNQARKEAFEFMTEVGPEMGVGLLWWHATGDSSEESQYRLKNDGSGFWTDDNSGNLTEGGETFWEFSQTNHEVEEFVGVVPTGGCEALRAAVEDEDELEQE